MSASILNVCDDVLVKVLAHLSFKDIAACKKVNRQFYTLCIANRYDLAKLEFKTFYIFESDRDTMCVGLTYGHTGLITFENITMEGENTWTEYLHTHRAGPNVIDTFEKVYNPLGKEEWVANNPCQWRRVTYRDFNQTAKSQIESLRQLLMFILPSIKFSAWHTGMNLSEEQWNCIFECLEATSKYRNNKIAILLNIYSHYLVLLCKSLGSDRFHFYRDCLPEKCLQQLDFKDHEISCSIGILVIHSFMTIIIQEWCSGTRSIKQFCVFGKYSAFTSDYCINYWENYIKQFPTAVVTQRIEETSRIGIITHLSRPADDITLEVKFIRNIPYSRLEIYNAMFCIKEI